MSEHEKGESEPVLALDKMLAEAQDYLDSTARRLDEVDRILLKIRLELRLSESISLWSETDQATESAMDAHFRSSDGPHAKAVANELRATIEKDYDAVVASVREFGSAMIKLRETADLEETMRRVARFTLAAEVLCKAAEFTERDGRAALLHAFDETGIPGVFLLEHTVTAVEGQKGVIVPDPSHPALARFMVPRDPVLNRDAVRRALEAGEDLDGAVALANSGTRYVRFSKREKRGATT